MTDSVNLRALALESLLEINENQAYSHRLLRDVLGKYAYLEKQERAFYTRLVEGTLERMTELDYVLDQFSNTKTAKMKPLIRNLLRMSIYQLLYMDTVPDSAVCNEAVKLAKKRGFSQLSGFVNGLLRNIARSRGKIAYPDEEKEPLRFLSVRYSMPEWIVSVWMNAYGKEKTKQILQAFYQEYPLTVRTNQMRAKPIELKQHLTNYGVDVREIGCMTEHAEDAENAWQRKLPPALAAAYERVCEYAFEVSGLSSPAECPAFADGEFYIQDVTSMLVAEAAEPEKNSYCIDVCAAPGGKSLHLAELMEGTGTVEARDLTEYKVALIEENVLREGLSNIKTVCMDAECFDADSIGKADILLCDLPCSGLGVMGNKPEIRYRMTEDKQKELVELQRRILKTVCPYVKDGGTLIYSTCTIHPAENEENAAWLAAEVPELSLEFMHQFFPGEAGRDGFFLAKLRKCDECTG